MDVAAWLRGLGLSQYIQSFADQDVDLRKLRECSEADLLELGVKTVGHRRRMLSELAALTPDGPPAPATFQRQAERRQLTVLYCDLVGSTALSQQMPAEDYWEMIRSFHRACAQVVADYDGWVANLIGDCVLAYLGWPRAHEDDAERAVRAGLAMVRAVPRLDGLGRAPLSVRVGIASGPVVVGDLIKEGTGQEHSAVGLAPSLGAELQALAAPGQVVIDELTRRLVGPAFAVRALGEHVLKGVGQPVAAYAVLGEHMAESRFDARASMPAPMIGRDQELAQVMERWAQALSGQGQAVLLVGEAGIGKSRLVRAVLDACSAQDHWTVRWQCSPYHGGSALWPVIRSLGQAAGLRDDDPIDVALDKLEAVIDGGAEAGALWATMMGLDGSRRYGPLEMAPRMLRERTLELLVQRLHERAAERGLLLVVEDAHWIDPTTLELIERCLADIDTARMLVLISSRPDDAPRWSAHPGVARLSLNGLGRSSVEALVKQVAGGGMLAPQLVATIVSRADGVPLFAEELTKATLETRDTVVPASLQGSLMARLDRVPEVKEVAQIAACIGREFDVDLVQAVTGSPGMVASAIDTLAAAQLVFKLRRSSERGGRACIFKHALVHEAAYESLLRGRREAIHARILRVLEADGAAPTPPEILAHHAERARLDDQGIEYWRRAGTAALGKSAYHEAAGHFGHAIGLISRATDRPGRAGDELHLQLLLGQACRSSQGYGATATTRAFERAYELSRAGAGDATQRFGAQYGLWAAHMNQARLKDALAQALQSLAHAQSSENPQLLPQAHRIVATSQLQLGDLAAASSNFERTWALLHGAAQPMPIPQLGIGVLTACQAWLSWTRQLQGFHGQSRQLAEQVRATGTQADQVDDRAMTLFLIAMRGFIARDSAAAVTDVEALAELAARYRLGLHSGYADCLKGWLAASAGRLTEGLSDYERGVETLTALQARVHLTYFLAGFAAVLGAHGRHGEALSAIERAIAHSRQSSQGWCDAELWRVRGEVILGDPGGRREEAVRSLMRAVALARRRGARLWELRAATSLAQVWARHGDRERALRLLTPIHAGFAETPDAVDIAQAGRLIGQLEQTA